LEITASDTQGGTSTRTIIFTKTNTPPTVPVFIGLLPGMRLPKDGTVSFKPSTDADGDSITYILQSSSTEDFTEDVQEFTGTGSPISYTNLPLDTDRFLRLAASDNKALTYSNAVHIKVNNVLEFKSTPRDMDSMPVSVRVRMRMSLPEEATLQAWVCNNFRDTTPAWEDCTEALLSGTEHEFTNATKTADTWAEGLWVKITAGTATGPIDARAFGLSSVRA
jgi:hypothetical protein